VRALFLAAEADLHQSAALSGGGVTLSITTGDLRNESIDLIINAGFK
jgi:hypothetical protein